MKFEKYGEIRDVYLPRVSLPLAFALADMLGSDLLLITLHGEHVCRIITAEGKAWAHRRRCVLLQQPPVCKLGAVQMGLATAASKAPCTVAHIEGKRDHGVSYEKDFTHLPCNHQLPVPAVV